MIMGYRLRELRIERKMSQEELGKLLGVSKVSVSGYESGKRVPCVDVFIKILDVFGVQSDYLLGREVDAVCEDDESVAISLSTEDIEIIREIRCRPNLYNSIAEDPKRFFSNICKKRI